DVTLVTGALDVQLLQDAVLHDGDTALLGLQHVDQHLFLHVDSLNDGHSSNSSSRQRSMTRPSSSNSPTPSARMTSSGLAVPLGVTRMSISRVVGVTRIASR